METKFNYFIVGFFVIFFTLVLIFWGAWIFSTGKGKVYTPYLVYMQEAVSGLNVNSPVKFNGVEVGYVDKISLDKHDPQRVRLLLQIEKGTPINAGTTATMMTQGLTGISYIGLKISDLDRSGPLKKPPGEEYPVITSTPSLLLQLDTSVRKVVQSFEDIDKYVKTLLSPSNRAAISRTLKNIDHITNTFATQDSENMSTLISNGAQASQDLTPLLKKLNHTADRIDELSEQLSQNPSILIRGEKSAPPGPGE